jgi:hypothetical protein
MDDRASSAAPRKNTSYSGRGFALKTHNPAFGNGWTAERLRDHGPTAITDRRLTADWGTNYELRTNYKSQAIGSSLQSSISPQSSIGPQFGVSLARSPQRLVCSSQPLVRRPQWLVRSPQLVSQSAVSLRSAIAVGPQSAVTSAPLHRLSMRLSYEATAI